MKANKVSAAVVCDFLGVSNQTFATMIKDGIFERQLPSNGYDLRAVVRACFAHSRRIAGGRGGVDGGAVLSSARARQSIAAAEHAEFRNAIQRGDYVLSSLVEERLGSTFAMQREIALSVPGKCADSLTPFTPKSREGIAEILQIEMTTFLAELAEPHTYKARAVGGSDG